MKFPTPTIDPAQTVLTTPSSKRATALARARIGIYEVHYTGWLEDGCVFGTTYNAARAARFFLPFVIPGWRQSLEDMNIGERRRIRIHPTSATGKPDRHHAYPQTQR